MTKMGRPVIKIDWKGFDKLCSLKCTLREIAGFFECSEDTIERRVKEEKGMLFAEYYKQKEVIGNISIRRAQHQRAVDDKNTTMLIWLGKQRLNQKDQIEHEVGGKEGKPLKVIYSLDKKELDDE